MYSFCIVLLCFSLIHYSLAVVIPTSNLARRAETPSNTGVENYVVSGSLNETCLCGVFLTGQFKKGSPKPPTGNPVVTIEPDEPVPCDSTGVRRCTSKCLETLAPFLKEITPRTICAAAEREIFKERTYLFLKNCNSDWKSTRMSAGREYCCDKNNEFYSCPMFSI